MTASAEIDGPTLATILDRAARHPDPDLIARIITAAVFGLRAASPKRDETVKKVRTLIINRSS